MTCLRPLLMVLLLCVELTFVRADGQVVRCEVRNGKTPIAGATAEVVLSLPKSQADSDDYTVIEETFFESGERGEFDIALPDLDLADLRIAINVLRPGFEPYHSRSYELDEFLHPRFDGRTIQLEKLYRWRAQILGADGKAAASAKVRVCPKQDDLFSLQLPTEPQNFTANKEGIVEVTSARTPDLRVTSMGEAPLLVAGFDAEVASQQTTTHLQMTRGTLLKGNVKTASGKPIPFAAIVAGETSGRYRMHHAVAVVSDALGNYELPPLPEGRYQVTVIGRVSETISNSTVDSLRKRARPTNDLFLPRLVRLESTSSVQELDFHASKLKTIALKARWQGEREDAASIRLMGFLSDRTWHSESQLADSNCELQFSAPVSLQQAYFATGVVQIRDSDGKLRLADFVPVEKETSQVEVVFPSLADLKVRVVLPDNVSVDIVAFYARKGRRRGYASEQPIYLGASRTKQRDSTLEYFARAIVGEEIVFQVRSRSNARKVIGTQRFTLKDPGIHEIDLDLSQPN